MSESEALDKDQSECVLSLDDAGVVHLKGCTIGNFSGIWNGNTRFGLVAPRACVDEIIVVKGASGVLSLGDAMVDLKANASTQPCLPHQTIGTSERELVPKPIAIRFVVCIALRTMFPPRHMLGVNETMSIESYAEL